MFWKEPTTPVFFYMLQALRKPVQIIYTNNYVMH